MTAPLATLRRSKAPGCVVMLLGAPAALYLGWCGLMLAGGSLAQWAEGQRYLGGAVACLAAVALGAWQALRATPSGASR